MVCVNGPDEIDYRYLFSNVYYCNTFTTRSAIDCRWEQPSPALIIVSIDFFLTLFSYQQNNSKELHPSLITLYCISIFILLVFGTLNKTTKFCKHTFTKKQSRSIVSSLSTAYHQSCIEKRKKNRANHHLVNCSPCIAATLCLAVYRITMRYCCS